jgi:3'-phosphoadenosine 5'-phosphosulfate sulfotransferase (PAPS reductase)/FAD synthetase
MDVSSFAVQPRLIPGRDPGAIIESAGRNHRPSKAFVLFSGGKDSSVTLDYMARFHRDKFAGALHINTGIGIPSTREFAKAFCDERDIPFHEARAPIAYEDLVVRGWWNTEKKRRENGFPGPAAHLFTYSMLKERPLDAFVSIQKDGRLDRIGLITGVRAEESRRRMGTTQDVKRDGAQVWIAPLIDWSSYDMQQYREKYDVPMSPSSRELHLSGECLCGAFGSEDELALIAAFYPAVGKRIYAIGSDLEKRGIRRCVWGRPYGDEKPPLAPGPLCVGCSWDADEDAA